MNKEVVLKPGRDKSVIRRHPWIFTGAVKTVNGSPKRGETVGVRAADGRLLGYGSFSPDSQMLVRMWTFADEPVDAGYFRSRIAKALEMRKPPLVGEFTTGVRLIHAESDGLPGVTADRYGDFVICQFSSAGADYWKNTIASLLMEMVPVKGIYERSDLAVRKKEGLIESTGRMLGEEPPEEIEISEEGRTYRVDVRTGHKTGFYLDQRDNRSQVGRFAAGREVLDCFSYTGGFAVAALAGGASHVTLVDSSGPAMARAEANILANGFGADRYTPVEADVFRTLRDLRTQGKAFDLVVLDPPKFVESQNQLEKGARAYKDINRVALQLVTPGGYLFTFSCSGHMEDSLFQKIVADAALDAGREIRFVKWLAQAADHPVMSGFPEGKYLKGLIVWVS